MLRVGSSDAQSLSAWVGSNHSPRLRPRPALRAHELSSNKRFRGSTIGTHCGMIQDAWRRRYPDPRSRTLYTSRDNGIDRNLQSRSVVAQLLARALVVAHPPRRLSVKLESCATDSQESDRQ